MKKHVIESFARITRCKDCKHSVPPGKSTSYCKSGVLKCMNRNAPCVNRLVYPEDYCSYGYAKES